MCGEASRVVHSGPQRSDLPNVSFVHNFYIERVSGPFDITINNSYSIVLIGGQPQMCIAYHGMHGKACFHPCSHYLLAH